MDYETMLATVTGITTSSNRGSFSYDYEGTGYLFEFIDTGVRNGVATALIRGGANVERRGNLELFVQL